jgi:hypothetical protein
MVMPAWVTTTARVARRVPAEAGGGGSSTPRTTRAPLAWAERHVGGAVPRSSLGSRSSSVSRFPGSRVPGFPGSRVLGFLGVPRSSSEFLGSEFLGSSSEFPGPRDCVAPRFGATWLLRADARGVCAGGAVAGSQGLRACALPLENHQKAIVPRQGHLHLDHNARSSAPPGHDFLSDAVQG